ncbi:helix-turn-helix domain-containing protein [Parasphingorhabdus pacifica]
MARLNETHTPKARLLGAELRDLRLQVGLNGRQLAAELGITQTTVSRYERGERTAPVDYVARVLGMLGITGQRYDELIAFAETASEPDLIANSKSGLHGHLIELAEFERSAEVITAVAPLVVPGFLQTRAYARQIMSTVPEEQREVRIELRMARREILQSQRRIQVFLSERVLREAMGDRSVMSEQVAYLHDFAQRPNIAIQILPSTTTGWTLAHNGSFTLFEFAKAAPTVHLEHFRGPAFLYDEADVEDYRTELVTLAATAMTPQDSVALLTDLANQWKGNHDAETAQLAEVH